MSKLSEILEDLLNENNLSHKAFADAIGISASRVTDYIRNEKLPSVATLIKIADYFNCSTDFILGRAYENDSKNFCNSVPFAERLVYLKDYFGCTHKDIYSKDGITKSRYFEWLSGKRQPSIDNIVNLADSFHCSVDFILGREK